MIEYRNIFYIGLLFFIPFILVYLVNSYRGLPVKKFSAIITLLLIAFSIYMFTNRPVEFASDTANYISKLNFEKNEIFLGKSFNHTKDIAWDIFIRICAFLDLSDRTFLFICASLFLIPLLLAIYKLFGSNNMLLVFYLLFSCFFFWSSGTNVLRSGIAFSFFMLAISYKGKSSKEILFFILSILFHLSFIFPVCAWYIFKYIKISIKYVLIIWGVCLIISYLNINILNNIIQLIGSTMINDRINTYVNFNYTDYGIGFRLDFIFFSLFFICTSLFSRGKIYSDNFYELLLRVYIIANAFFLLTMNIIYSDRFALLSWMLIPVLIAYPLIQSRYKNGRILLFLFSLSMIFFNFLIF